MNQAFALDKIEAEGTPFKERMDLILQLENYLETIQMDIERAKLARSFTIESKKIGVWHIWRVK